MIKLKVNRFNCVNNKLENLKGIEEYSIRNLHCSGNRLLTSLEGCPEEIHGGLFVNNCNLKNLKFAPNYVGSLYCNLNQLNSLEGCPKYIMGYFYIEDNDLESLDGCPIYVKNDFMCSDNTKRFSEAEIRSICNVGGKVAVW